jgi:hypothetical protein
MNSHGWHHNLQAFGDHQSCKQRISASSQQRLLQAAPHRAYEGESFGRETTPDTIAGDESDKDSVDTSKYGTEVIYGEAAEGLYQK